MTDELHDFFSRLLKNVAVKKIINLNFLTADHPGVVFESLKTVVSFSNLIYFNLSRI